MFISFWDFKKLASEKVTCTINGTLTSLVYEGAEFLRFEQIKTPYKRFYFHNDFCDSLYRLNEVLIISERDICILDFN